MILIIYSFTLSRSLVVEYICPAGDIQPRSVRAATLPSMLYPVAILALTLYMGLLYF